MNIPRSRGPRGGKTKAAIPQPGPAPGSSRALLSRYECKYIVSAGTLPQMRAFIEPFTRPDRYAEPCPGYRYEVCSLYFDTDDLRLYLQTVAGEKDRFKLRLRTYGNGSPIFFEVKRKVNNIVKKHRAPLSPETARMVLTSGVNGQLGDLPPGILDAIEKFHAHARLGEARPVLRVKYMREAYESKGGDPVRITFDTELMHAVTLDSNMYAGGGRWLSTPIAGPILEIKFTERFPEWVHDLVCFFGLKQRSVPKYVMSLDHVLADGRESALSIARFILPPRRC